MDQKSGKLRTKHKALQPRDDLSRLYVPRKEGGRGVASIEEGVDVTIQRLDEYIKNSEERLITTANNKN